VAFLVCSHGRRLEVDDLGDAADWTHCALCEI
jgi:hypothetical protein